MRRRYVQRLGIVSMTAFWAASLCMLPPAAQASGPSTASLDPEYAAIVPGQPVWVALKIKLDDGWHTYWRNPGDAGAPTTVEWHLPPGFKAGPIVWPTPERFRAGPLISFGYQDEVWLLTQIEPPTDIQPRSDVIIAADAEWLVCAEICIPQYGTFTINLPVTDKAPKFGFGHQAAFTAARERLPQPAPPSTMTVSAETVAVAIPLAATPSSVADVWLFPNNDGVIDYSVEPQARVEAGTLRVTARRAAGAADEPTAIGGVVTFSDGDTMRALDFHATAAGSFK